MTTYHPIKYPKLSNDFIRAKANELLESYFKCPLHEIEPPIPVDEIATFLGFEIEYDILERRGLPPEVDGAIIFQDKQIWVDSRLDGYANYQVRGRENYTISHEIGHEVLHRSVLENLSNITSLFPIDDSRILCRTDSKKEIQEQQADSFAAKLLMPSTLVKRYFEKICDEQQLLPVEEHLQERVCSYLQTCFGTSYTAMNYRLEQLGLFRNLQRNRLLMP